MRHNCLFLLFFPVIAYGNIRIKIKASESEDLSSVDFSGLDVAIISDQEREAFELDDESLKKASKLHHGRRCTDVFLKRPTPWEDVYRKFHWREVRRTLIPIDAKILSIKTKPMIVKIDKKYNPSSLTVSMSAGVVSQEEQSVTHSWKTDGELSVSRGITYSIGFAGGGAAVGGSTSLIHASKWGEEVIEQRKVTIGSASTYDVKVPPKHGIRSTLVASQGTMEVQVDYEATVEGDIFCNHHGKYKGHMWWAYDLERLQELGHLPKVVKSTEIISIGFFSKVIIKVSDINTTEVMKRIPAGIIKQGKFVSTKLE